MADGIDFHNFATGPGNSKIWIRDQQPDQNNQVEAAGHWNGRASNSLGESQARRYRPGVDPPMTFLTLWDYHDGVGAAINEPRRYRIEDMEPAHWCEDGTPDNQHAQLIADADARRPTRDATQKAIMNERGAGPAPDAKELALHRARGIAAALLIAALALCGLAPKADAGPQAVLCAAQTDTNTAGQQVNIPNLSQRYSADNQGCVVANGVGDIAILKASGYQPSGGVRSLSFATGVATGTTSFLVGQIPAGAYVQQIIYNNITANAAGNISFGSTSGGADVVAAAACGANCLTRVTDALLLKSVFSATTPQQLFVTSSAWGSANLNITVVYGFY